MRKTKTPMDIAPDESCDFEHVLIKSEIERMRIREESIGIIAVKNLFRGNWPSIFEYIYVTRVAINIEVIITSILEISLEITRNSFRIGRTRRISKVLFSTSLAMAPEAIRAVRNPPI